MKNIIFMLLFLGTFIPGWICAEPPDEEVFFPRSPPYIYQKKHKEKSMERLMNRLQKNQPEEFERLKILQKEDPEAFRSVLHERLMKRVGEHFHKWKKRKPNPDVLRLEKEIKNLARAYHTVSNEQAKASLKAEITQRTEVVFELRQKDRKRKIKRIEKELEKLQKTFEEMSLQHKTHIEKRVERALK